jgi:hypothetical protein
VEQRVLTKASIGYRIHKVIEESKKRDGTVLERELPGAVFERLIDQLEQSRDRDRPQFVALLDREVGKLDRDDDDETTYRAMDWEPYENSLVTIPADNTVGLGRAVKNDVASAASQSAVVAPLTKGVRMKRPRGTGGRSEAAEQERKRAERAEMEKREREAQEELRRLAADPLALEQSRQNAIKNVAKANKIRTTFGMRGSARATRWSRSAMTSGAHSGGARQEQPAADRSGLSA